MRLYLRYLLIVAFFAWVLYPSSAQDIKGTTPELDSLIQAASSMKEDTAKVMLLNKISFQYSSISPYEGIQYGMEGLMLAEQIDFKRGVARANSALGANYFSLSDFPNAYKYWLNALNINEEVGHKEGVANHLHNIGMVFFTQKEYDKALDYYNRALVVSKEIGNDRFATNSYTAMGKVYAAQKNYSQSLENHFKSLALDRSSGNEKAISSDMLNIGSVYAEQGDFSRALDMLTQSLEIKKRISDNKGLAEAYNQIGRLYYSQSDMPRSLAYLDSAVLVGKKISNLDNLQSNYQYLAKTHEQLGNYKEALQNYKDYYSIKDSIFSGSRKSEIFNLEKKAQLEEKKRLEEREALRKEKIKYIQMAGISLFIILLIGTLLMVGKVRISGGWLEMLSTLSVILLFEFIQLLMHGTIEKITHHDLLLTYLCLLALAAIVLPIHHRFEHWMKKKISAKQLVPAKKDDEH